MPCLTLGVSQCGEGRAGSVARLSAAEGLLHVPCMKFMEHDDTSRVELQGLMSLSVSAMHFQLSRAD